MWNYIRFPVCFVFFLYVLFVTGQNEKDSEFGVTEGLSCYACYGIGPDNECEQYEPYRKAREDGETEGPVKLKTCSAPFNKSCMMETYRSNLGDVVSIRDCSDDKTFDFTEIMSNASSYKRLLELQDNNETACAWDSEHLVCLSKCAAESVNDTANFCNGPQFDHAYTNCISLVILFVSTAIVNLCKYM